MCLRRAVLMLATVIGVLFLIRQPVAAAHTATAIIQVLSRVADALGRFGSTL
jgi:hypothetical protein